MKCRNNVRQISSQEAWIRSHRHFVQFIEKKFDILKSKERERF
jgi:hypothetical protein